MTATAIINCWRKSGLLTTAPVVEPFIQEVEPEFEDDIAELDRLDTTEPCSIVPTDDASAIVSDLQQEIQHAARSEGHDDDEEEEDNSESTPPPSTADILQAADILRRGLCASNADASVHASFSKVENFLIAKGASRLRQPTISEMFRT